MDARKDVNLLYDSKADVCYLSFGEPTPSICEEVDKGVLVRLKPETGEVTGITIIDFSKFANVPLTVPTHDWIPGESAPASDS